MIESMGMPPIGLMVYSIERKGTILIDMMQI